MKIVPRDQGSHLIVVYFSSFSTLKLVVHAIFYFEKFSETIESSDRDREFKNTLLLLVKVYPYGPGSSSNGFQKGKDQDPWFGSRLEV